PVCHTRFENAGRSAMARAAQRRGLYGQSQLGAAGAVLWPAQNGPARESTSGGCVTLEPDLSRPTAERTPRRQCVMGCATFALRGADDELELRPLRDSKLKAGAAA